MGFVRSRFENWGEVYLKLRFLGRLKNKAKPSLQLKQ
ncbi:hypothetical protein PESP_b6000 [Pseudoalteromonas espejiana DSM 9414]|nr:hypothetical protein PESP_b6000 [Pseudoalteromonas espejiana DSM 9414]